MPGDAVLEQQKLTVQAATREDYVAGAGLLFWLAQSGQIIPPWWSKERDRQLRNFSKNSDHFSGATWMIATKLAAVPHRVEPRDNSVKAHVRQADYFNMLLAEGIQFGGGWAEFWHLWFADLWTQDNGAFGEVIGEGDPLGPIRGPVVGLAHLDSFRCTRTSNVEFPVVYQDTDGKRYRFHHTRVIFSSQQPSPASEMNSVGLCWLSRAVNSVQNLIDIAVYKQEKLGSRPLRGILKGKGIKASTLMQAIHIAEESMDNQGQSRFAKMALVASTDPNFDLDILDLASMPDGFDEDSATRLGMLVIALAGGFPPRWIWPATVVGATRADAMYQHIAGAGGGAAWHLNMMRTLLAGPERGDRHMTGKVLPPHLKIVFDYQDDEQDERQANIRKVRADTREKNLNTGVVNVRTARERALADGDLTRAQFDELELEDGRLDNGDDVLTLFATTDEFFVEMLDLGVDEPLLPDLNDAIEMLLEIDVAALDCQDVLVSASRARERIQAKQALSALAKLKQMYEEVAAQQMQAEAMEQLQAEAAAQEPPPGEGEEGGEGEEEGQEGEETKPGEREQGKPAAPVEEEKE
ncbi:MAG TPA: hypothetical protein VM011_14590 [Gammaproteobacteria bacterium]|nr:hypothetical protein [Gammaproteobacteria bacterium]